jgi:HrpA-like RNA helicase
MNHKQKNIKPFFKHDHNIPIDLPIHDVIDEFNKAMKDNIDIIQVIGSTGSGKSIILPSILAEEGYTVYVSVPTIAAVNGIMECMRENARDMSVVGYSCGSEKFYNSYTTRVVYATTQHILNVLMRVLNGKQQLPKNFVLFVDEAHHTSIENSALMCFAKFMKTTYPKKFMFRIITASATMIDMVYPNFSTSIIRCDGRLYPIQTHFHTETIDSTKEDLMANTLVDIVTRVHLDESDLSKAFLVFVSGESMTVKLADIFSRLTNVVAFELHSGLQKEEIRSVFKTYKGVRKIIVSTNIAESSVTITDVRYVFDMCLHKVPYMIDGRTTLKTILTSRNNSKQRSGRAGRLGEGHYYPFITEDDYANLQLSETPDIERMLPFKQVLDFMSNGLPAMDILDVSEERRVMILKELAKLNLIDKCNVVTNLGKEVLKYPVDLECAVMVHHAKTLALFSISDGGDDISMLSAIAILIFASVLSAIGTNGSMYWIGKENRKEPNRSDYMKTYFDRFEGSDDVRTWLNVFVSAIVEVGNDVPKDMEYSKFYFDWVAKNSLNNKTIKLAFQTFRRLVNMTIPNMSNNSKYNPDKFAHYWLQSYNVYNESGFDENVMTKLYDIIGSVYSDKIFDSPDTDYNGNCGYHDKSGKFYKIDQRRTHYSSTRNPKSIVALFPMIIEHGRGKNHIISGIAMYSPVDESDADNSVCSNNYYDNDTDCSSITGGTFDDSDSNGNN